MAGALFRPLTPKWGMQKRWTDGSRMEELAAAFIKPNDRLSSFERLEIYNRTGSASSIVFMMTTQVCARLSGNGSS